jgi:hypothetical protein
LHAASENDPEPGPTPGELAAGVRDPELLRLVGVPRGRALEAPLRARLDGARAWYAANGRPFAATRRVAVAAIGADAVTLADGTPLGSRTLADSLRAARGHAVLVLAVSAGREVAAEIAGLWAERPDEAFFLDRFAAAVTEALVPWASGRACREASGASETLLPPVPPGCADFDLGDQQRLARLLGGVPAPADRLRLGPIELLATGAIDPPHSLLAAAAVTRERLAAATPEDLCRACALEPCGFRRAPRSRARGAGFASGASGAADA